MVIQNDSTNYKYITPLPMIPSPKNRYSFMELLLIAMERVTKDGCIFPKSKGYLAFYNMFLSQPLFPADKKIKARLDSVCQSLNITLQEWFERV
jgi:hypothetical protein